MASYLYSESAQVSQNGKNGREMSNRIETSHSDSDGEAKTNVTGLNEVSKNCHCLADHDKSTPGRIRTSDLRIRKPLVENQSPFHAFTLRKSDQRK